LAVEARSGLVEEEEEFRLGDQFDGNGKTLALLDVETFAGNTGERVRLG